jgi:hypothetical protein
MISMPIRREYTRIFPEELTKKKVAKNPSYISEIARVVYEV